MISEEIIPCIDAEMERLKNAAQIEGVRDIFDRQHENIRKLLTIGADIADTAYEPIVAAWDEANTDLKRLVREIDVILNGEEGAARQASLCDLVGQIRELKTEKDQLEAYRDRQSI